MLKERYVNKEFSDSHLANPEPGSPGTIGVEHRVDFYDEVSRFEIALIKGALKKAKGSQKRAAALLGLRPTTLNTKIRIYKIYSANRYRTNRHANTQDQK